MRRCSFLFSLVVVVVSAQTSIPNITLVGNKNKKELHCVIANDTSNSAITFVGDGIMDEDAIQYDTPANLCMAQQDGDPFQCVEHQPHIKKYTRENSTHGFAGHVLDRRWEGFRTIRTPKGQYAFPEVIGIPDHDFKIAFSVRVKQDGHILLCDGDKPQESNCYWFILAGWEGKRTAMRRCEKEIPMVEDEYPKRCKKPIAEKNITDLTSVSEWSHFRIELKGNVISLYKFGDKDPILTYSDRVPIKLGYLTFRSPTQTGLWKIHQYNFMKVDGDVTITTTTLRLPTSSRCVAIYVKLCANCKADISLLDGSTRLAERNVEGNKWMEIQLRIPNTSDNIRAEIKASLTKGANWYIGEILECIPDGIRKITTDVKNSGEICCNIIKSGRTICKKDIDTKIVTQVTLEQDCPRNTIGRHCIPCTLFESCENYKYCQYTAVKTIQCYCPKGFSGKNCLEKCNNKTYGDLCTKTCNRCLTGCSHDDGRCEISGCKDNNLYGDYCQSSKKPVLKDNPQMIIGHTNITINLTTQYNGIEPPTFFKIQLKNSTGMWIDAKREPFTNVSKSVTINNLLPDTDYSVRTLLETAKGEAYQVDEFIPTSNFTTTCKELSSDMIKVMVNGTSVRLQVTDSLEICNVDKYRRQHENYDLPISNAFTGLVPCLQYSIEIIKKQSPTSKHFLFNVGFKTGSNTSEVIQCPEMVNVTDTSVILKWDYNGDKPIKYEISYRKYWNKNCKEAYPESWSKPFTVENTNVTIPNLDPDTRYIVEITPTGIDDKNSRKNIEFYTRPSDILKEDSLTITTTKGDGILEVTAQISDCTKITGPIDLTLEVKCESPWCAAEDSNVLNRSNVIYNMFPFNVKGLTDYSVLTTIRRNSFEKKLDTLRLTTSPSAPGLVIDPVIYSKTENSMLFRWRPPYPPMGNLENYRINYKCTSPYCLNKELTANCMPIECLLYPDQHCCSIGNLAFSKDYDIKICAMNENITNCGTDHTLKGRSRQEKPNPPDSIDVYWKSYSILTVSFKHPSITNGPLTNYSIYVNGTQHVNERIHQEHPSYSHELHNIQPAKVVSVRVMVSNKAGDSNHSLPIDTISPPPTLPDPIVLDVQATNLTIGIPTLKLPNEVTCSLLVFVIDKNSTGGPSEKQKRIFEDYNITQNGHKSWVAIDTTLRAEDDEKWKIMIGSTAERGVTKGNSSDRTLNTETQYDIIVVVITTFRNISRIEKYTFTETTNFGDPSANNLYLLLLIILPVICAICFVVLRRRGINITLPTQFIFRNTVSENTSNHSNMPLTAITPQQPQRTKVLKDQPTIYQNAIEALEEDGQFSRIVKISELEEYVKNSLEHNEFERQHALFPRGQTKPWVYGMKPENKKKNRYINLAAYDHTRVKLEVIDDDPNTDYINANYIDGYNYPKAFIATQGPKEATLNDFWRMIWQENVEHIIMIANLVEGGKKKVAKYWPDINETMTFGDISVKYISVDIFADYEERVFSATRNGHQSRRIKQLHFVSWPDHGVPLYPQSLAPFHKRMLAIAPSNKPVVVHCSAGVGRTGTFILCDTCLRMAALEGQVDILHHQFNLREQRPNMVDNVEQYKLVHMVLLQCLIAPDTSILCTENMTQHVETLLASREIQKQMKYLDASAWQDDAMKMGTKTQSAIVMPEKNRLRDVIPDECSKVILSPYPITDESTTYINAIRVAGFRDLSKYVVTQYPMKNTVGDFWRLIHQHEITVVVCLNTINKKDPNLPRFYPTEDCQEMTPVPYLTVQLVSVDEGTQISTYTFDLVEQKQNTITTKLTLLQLNGWKIENITPDSAEGLLSLYEEANRLGKSCDEILISCYDGVRASGLFTAMSFVIDKIKLEQLCDVCLAVRSVRHSRGEFVRDINQFKYLYKCALEYVLKFALYSNFRS